MPAFVMPQLGESDVEGTVLRWLKQPGEHVRADEPLVEVETEKVNVEIPSPFEGTLTSVLVQEGETVPVGATLAVIGAATAEEMSAVPPPVPTPAPEPAAVTAPPAAARNGATPPVPPAVAQPDGGRYSPAVLRLASEHQVDLNRIRGTGMNGRVTRKDVQAYIDSGGLRGAAVSPPAVVAAPVAAPAVELPQPATPPPATPAPAATDEEIVKPSATRLTIARNMLRAAQSIPAAWMVVEVDVTKLVRLRTALKEEFERREGVSLSYLPFVIKALAETLKEHPMLNSQWRDDQIVLKKRVNIGIAVGSDEGLVVPNIHDADRLSIAGLAHAVVDLAERARTRRLRLEDVQGGTFTLDNTGVFGSVVSQPIINPPQCAILSTEAIIKRPVAVDDAIAIRSLMNLCISFDHRIVDGSHVGPFMQAIKRRLEAYGPETGVY